MKIGAMTIGLVVCLFACSGHRRPSEGYHVTGFDGKTGEWTILRADTQSSGYQGRRLTVVCDFYKWRGEVARGPRACDLRVGSSLTSTVFTKRKGDATDLWIEETSDKLSIIRGSGEDEVFQNFRIVKNDLLPPSR